METLPLEIFSEIMAFCSDPRSIAHCYYASTTMRASVCACVREITNDKMEDFPARDWKFLLHLPLLRRMHNVALFVSDASIADFYAIDTLPPRLERLSLVLAADSDDLVFLLYMHLRGLNEHTSFVFALEEEHPLEGTKFAIVDGGNALIGDDEEGESCGLNVLGSSLRFFGGTVTKIENGDDAVMVISPAVVDILDSGLLSHMGCDPCSPLGPDNPAIRSCLAFVNRGYATKEHTSLVMLALQAEWVVHGKDSPNLARWAQTYDRFALGPRESLATLQDARVPRRVPWKKFLSERMLALKVIEHVRGMAPVLIDGRYHLLHRPYATTFAVLVTLGFTHAIASQTADLFSPADLSVD